jgi:hypothetical protein
MREREREREREECWVKEETCSLFNKIRDKGKIVSAG